MTDWKFEGTPDPAPNDQGYKTLHSDSFASSRPAIAAAVKINASTSSLPAPRRSPVIPPKRRRHQSP